MKGFEFIFHGPFVEETASSGCIEETIIFFGCFGEKTAFSGWFEEKFIFLGCFVEETASYVGLSRNSYF